MRSDAYPNLVGPRSDSRSLPEKLGSPLNPSAKPGSSHSISIASSSDFRSSLSSSLDDQHRAAALLHRKGLDDSSTHSSRSEKSSEVNFHALAIKEKKTGKIKRYCDRLSQNIHNSDIEINPIFFANLFTSLNIDEILEVLETPITKPDRSPVFFGQPGTMSVTQLQQYLEWMFSTVQKVRENPLQLSRLLNLLQLAIVPKLSTLTSYIGTVNEEKLTEAYLNLISLFADCLPARKIINFIRVELAAEDLTTFLQDEQASHLFATLLIRITRSPHVSNLILTHILQPDDLLIRMLHSSNSNVRDLLCALEETADVNCFHQFLQQRTHDEKTYVEEIAAQLPMFLYNHALSLKKTEDIASFAKIEGVSKIIITLVYNEIDSMVDLKEKEKRIQSLSNPETPTFHFFSSVENIKIIQRELYVNMAVSALTGHLDINIEFKTLVKKILDGQFTRADIEKYFALIKTISIEKEADSILCYNILEVVNDQIRKECPEIADHDFYYDELFSLLEKNKLTVLQAVKLVTHDNKAHAASSSSLRFSILQQRMLRYIENLALQEKIKTLETLSDPKSALFNFFAGASSQILAKIEEIKVFPCTLSAIMEGREIESGVNLLGLQKPMLQYIESLKLKEKVEVLQDLFKEESPLNMFFLPASHDVKVRAQWVKMTADREYQREQAKLGQGNPSSFFVQARGNITFSSRLSP